MKTVGKWLVETILGWLSADLLPKIMEHFKNWVSDLMRSKKQDEATKKVEQDIKEEKPRDDETRKRESDWLNS
jgi:hypothetical protein